MFYAYKPNARIKADPQTTGEICETLVNTGGLTPKRLLDESRPESAPLHGEFEWDDSIAAENYRESQAAHIIRCIVVKPASKEQTPVRAFINIESETRDYQPISVVVSTPDMRDYMLKAALRDLESFKCKYNTLSSLQPVFEAIENVNKAG